MLVEVKAGVRAKLAFHLPCNKARVVEPCGISGKRVCNNPN